MSAVLWLSAAGLTLVAGSLFRRIRRYPRLRRAARLLGICLMLPGVAGFGLRRSLAGYTSLVPDQPIAGVTFTQQGPDLFLASLQLPDGRVLPLDIHGNEWQIDARILTWDSWATWLGMHPLYRFERISGRYADIRDEREKPRSVHPLYEPGTSWWQEWIQHGTRLPGADAYYGTAAFVPMADGAGYRISVSDSGLVVRPVNPAAEQAVGNWPTP